jgi:glucose/arabinose dehydrogenase
LLALSRAVAACGEQQKAAPPAAPARAERAANEPAAEADADIVVVVRDIAQVPPTSKDRPLARINAVVHAGDGAARLFAVDMDGSIHVLDDGQLLPTPFLDMTKARSKAFVHDDVEKGLTSVAFHPDYARAGAPGFGKVYTASTELSSSAVADFGSPDPNGVVSHHDVIAEWRIDASDPNRIDPGSRREVLRIAHPLRDHTIGQIAFNPNARPGDADYGRLYIGVGDGGDTLPVRGEIDQLRNAQNTKTLLGKILRIDPLAAAGRKYTVPPDNPVVASPNHLPEIWAYGLRNPQRFCWDTGGSGTMLIVDIGQAQVEEVNIGKAGANYGWSEREGDLAVNRRDQDQPSDFPANDATFGYTYPAIQYRHDIGRAITGCCVYRGRLLGALRGKYVFGDIVSGRIFFVDVARLASGGKARFAEIRLKYLGRQRTLLEILGNDSRADLRFGVDAAGEIYLVTKRDGMIRKLSIVEN